MSRSGGPTRDGVVVEQANWTFVGAETLDVRIARSGERRWSGRSEGTGRGEGQDDGAHPCAPPAGRRDDPKHFLARDGRIPER